MCVCVCVCMSECMCMLGSSYLSLTNPQEIVFNHEDILKSTVFSLKFISISIVYHSLNLSFHQF